MASIEISSSASFGSVEPNSSNSVQSILGDANGLARPHRNVLPSFGSGCHGLETLESIIRTIKCGYLRDSIVRNVVKCSGEGETRSFARKLVTALEQ